MDLGPASDDAFESLNRYLVQQILGLPGYPQVQGEYTEPLYTQYLPGPSGMTRSVHYVSRSGKPERDPLLAYTVRALEEQEKAQERIREEVKRETARLAAREKTMQIEQKRITEKAKDIIEKAEKKAEKPKGPPAPREWGMLTAMRIGDREREVVFGRLSLALQGGYLTLEQFQARSDAVMAARTDTELSAPVRDLPVITAMQPRAEVRPARRAPAPFPMGHVIFAETFGLISLIGASVALGIAGSGLIVPVVVMTMMLFSSMIATISIAKKAHR